MRHTADLSSGITGVNVGVGHLLVAGAATAALTRMAVPWSYRELFEEVGKQESVDPDLLHAVAWHESRLNPAALGAENRNGTRDYGLMQINPVNFAALGLNTVSALDPETNVRAGARHIRGLEVVNKWLPDLLAVYNAGGSRVSGRVGGPKLDSRGRYINAAYVNAVLGRYVLVKLASLIPGR